MKLFILAVLSAAAIYAAAYFAFDARSFLKTSGEAHLRGFLTGIAVVVGALILIILIAAGLGKGIVTGGQMAEAYMAGGM